MTKHEIKIIIESDNLKHINNYLNKLTDLTNQFNGVINIEYKESMICKNCKHADLYLPIWTYPYHDPKCRLHHRNIKPDDHCKEFQPIIYNQFPCGRCYHQEHCMNDNDTIVTDCSMFISKELGEIRE